MEGAESQKKVSEILNRWYILGIDSTYSMVGELALTTRFL